MSIVTVKVPSGPECRDKGYWGDCKFIKMLPNITAGAVCRLYDQHLECLGTCNTSLGVSYAKCIACISHTIKED